MNTALFELKNIETGRRLKTILRQGRKQKKSYRTIAAELSEMGAPCGKTVVQEWCRALGIE